MNFDAEVNPDSYGTSKPPRWKMTPLQEGLVWGFALGLAVGALLALIAEFVSL